MNKIKSSFEIENILYEIFFNSSLHKFLDGGVYKGGFRPTNSIKNDICIGTLDLNRDNPQIGFFNVNVYVEELELNIDGKNEYIPNTQKLEKINELVESTLQKAFYNDKNKNYIFYISRSNNFKNTEAFRNETLLNFLVRFNIIN